MKFAFIPKAQYKIGQILTVHGKTVRVESYTHTGKNVTVHTVNAAKFERMVCICIEPNQIIQGVTA